MKHRPALETAKRNGKGICNCLFDDQLLMRVLTVTIHSFGTGLLHQLRQYDLGLPVNNQQVGSRLFHRPRQILKRLL